MSNLRIPLSYQIDKRIKVAQLVNNQAVLLVPLKTFQDITGIVYFEESRGMVKVSIPEYKELWGSATWTSRKKNS